MTWEKLLGYTGAQLKAMKPDELETLFGPYLHITRPDRATKPDTKSKGTVSKMKNNAANNMLSDLGLDFKF